ncbi:manganese/zinc/iron transport system substrate-binding protein [Pseudarthrobacter oxydans]|uniref:Manganese/zinc/iron transport system substrate-binding protein n=1 Tax=Pseudarthrobacter oxydans TaxID=1671 RepID=A0AAW8NFU8_PSEOX|nr:metal ABC transporter substrate-binding protein [Pseudarthrobacter oxydans]MDR7165746.1 manganese/zinc/iron transport system substrate-binding protein [Pseudarthrobacter oxydans]
MKITRKFLTGVAMTAIAVLGLTSCAGENTPAPGGDGDPLKVYATTGYLADAVANIAPDAEVTTMVGPGGDPHTYQPSTKDIETIQNADVVFWNGLHLEAQMIDQLESLGDTQLAVGDQLPAELLLDWPETDDQGNALHDPHVWNSPEAWTLIVGYVADKLGEIDPDNAAEYTANAEAYIEEIDAVVAEAHELLGDGKIEPRILITGHDAFNYFGQTFDLEVHATDFVSTEAKLSAGELSELAQLIADNEVPVIFQDNQANPQAITSLKEAVRALGWQVEVSGEELFADSLGAEDPVNTYIGAFSHNARAVAEALGTAGQ